MKSKLYLALVWVLVFFLGGIAGAVSYNLYRQHTRPKLEDFINKIAKDLKKDLKLDAQQTESIKVVFREHFKRKNALLHELQPRFDIIRNETDEKIKSILRPDQKLLFEERLKKCRNLGPPAPPPPASQTGEKRSLIQELQQSPPLPASSRSGKKGNVILDPPMPPPPPTLSQRD
jgi:hypothetical protein